MELNEKKIIDYFDNTLSTHGTTPKGVDWNSDVPQNLRFDQLLKVINDGENFSILDYGCGYGAFLTYILEKGYNFSKYIGFDISESMIHEANSLFSDNKEAYFTSQLDEIKNIDYVIASGVFNMKLDTPYNEWTEYVIKNLTIMNNIALSGFAITFLTKYSDKDKMRSDLYYADPCLLFDHCKQQFSKNVAILHDYGAYDFTLIVRKNI